MTDPAAPPNATPWPRAARVAIVAGLLLAGAAAAPLLARLSFEEDVHNWLPADDPQARRLAWHRRHFPADESALVAWDGATLGDPRLEALAASLREAEWVNRVVTPRDLIGRMAANRVPEPVARERLRGLLLGEAGAVPEDTPAGLLVTFDDMDENVLRTYLADLARRAAAAGIPRESLHVGGGPVATAELDRRLGLNRWNPAAPWHRPDEKSPLVLSAVVALVMAVALLRQLRLTGVVLGVTLLATAAGVAVLPATGTPMNMVLTVLPPLLLVLTLSAAIHVANYWRHAAARHGDPAVAAVAARTVAFWPCVLAAVTTAIGLASLLTSPLKPVRDFGLYSAVGVLIGLVAALFGLPALLSLVPMGRPRPPGREAAGWARLGRAVCRRGTAVALACLALGVAAGLGLTRFRTETRVIAYFPDDAPIVADYRFLERHLAGVSPVDFVVTFDAAARERLPLAERIELVREVEERLRAHPHVSGTLALPDFLPRPSDLSLAGRAEYVRRRLPRLEQAIAAGDDPEVVGFVRLAESGLDDGSMSPVRPDDEAWQIGAQVRVLSDVDFAVLAEELDRAARSVLGDAAGAGHFATGTVPLFLRTQQAVLDSLIVSFGIAFAVIAAVLAVVLRGLAAGVLAMLPNLLPVVVVFGAISWAGVPVDIGMMITASVALGIAVDGTLHLLTWYRENLAAGMGRDDAIAAALSHCGPAMWQTSGIICVSLLMLAFADLRLISRFGWLMAALIFAALLADLVFLPALLCGPLGRLLLPEPDRQGELSPYGPPLPGERG